jgi:predicted ATP-grasp superfamily ATP-dependent carboligase
MKLLIVEIPFQYWKPIIACHHKLVILDEADSITPKAQNLLSNIISKFRKATRIVFIRNHPNLKCERKNIQNQNNEMKIVPLSVRGYIKYNNDPNNVFRNNLDMVYILENKAKFGKYMLEHFPHSIPTVFYYQFNDETYVNQHIPNGIIKMIQKPNVNCGGKGITIVYKLNTALKDIIVSRYIEHKEYYVGHFLVLNGVIYEKIYFCSILPYSDVILKGRTINYDVKKTLPVDDTLFSSIFIKLSYSGFAACDFTIQDGNIKIFEINPRPGASLIMNKEYFSKFIDRLCTIIK